MNFFRFRQRYFYKRINKQSLCRVCRLYWAYLVISVQFCLLIRLYLNYDDLYRISNATAPETFWHIHYYNDRGFLPHRMKSPISLSNDSVVVMACGRNVENTLPGFQDNLYRLISLFKTYRILLGESDSKDNTLVYMQKWKRKDRHVFLYSYGNLTDTYSKYRTHRITFCRNSLLQKARENHWLDESNYLLVMDIDINSQAILTVKNFLSNFFYDPNEWAVMTASQTLQYYDVWALRTTTIDYDCWELVESFKHRQIAIEKYVNIHMKPIPIDFGLIPVRSAFGGFAIYQTKYLNNCIYDGIGHSFKETCEHITFHRCIVENGGKFFINPQFQNSNGSYL